MKIPFHDTNNSEFQEFILTESLESIDYLRPHLEEAIEEFVLPYLGKLQYQKLIQDYENEVIESDSLEEELLRHVQKVSVLFAHYAAIPELILHLSAAGFRNPEHQARIAKWQKEGVEASYKTKGYKALDRLLIFLEENASQFPKWKQSEGFQVTRKFFITSAEEFHQFVNINRSRLVFNKLASSMRYVEQHLLKPVLGDNLFDLVKYQFVENQLDEYNIKLIPFLKEALAWLAFEEGILNIVTEIGYQGIVQIPESTIEREQIKLSLIDKLQNKSKSRGEQMLFLLQEFLQKNVRDYPFFEDSDRYVEDSHLPFQSEEGDKLIYF